MVDKRIIMDALQKRKEKSAVSVKTVKENGGIDGRKEKVLMFRSKSSDSEISNTTTSNVRIIDSMPCIGYKS